jgi:hypothetical protein
MIDTVRFYQHRIYAYSVDLETVVRNRMTIPGFKVKGVDVDRFLVKHLETGLRVVFWSNQLQWVEVSLPRVLFGHNGQLLGWQSSIDAALLEVDAILNRISALVSASRLFRRVDLVWQFRDDPAKFYSAHQCCHHPMIHSPPVDYGNNGLSWRGSGLIISIYDKVLRETRKAGNIVRVELQLRSARLARILGRGQTVTRLKFTECYKAYRSIVRRFKPKMVIRDMRRDPLYLIAFAASKDRKYYWPLWARTFKSQQSRNRALRRLLAIKLKFSRVSWSELLPKKHPIWGAKFDAGSKRTTNVLYCA